MIKNILLTACCILLIAIVIVSFSEKAYLPPLSGSNTLDFPATSPLSVNVLTITVNGASAGDPVALGLPNGIVTGMYQWRAYCTTNTVNIEFINYESLTTLNPSSATFNCRVFKN